MKTLQLDGTTAYVTLASAEALGLVDRDFTVEAWVRLSGWADGSILNVLGSGTRATNQGLHLCVKNEKPHIGFYGGGTSGQSTLALDTWYHLAWRYTKSSAEQAVFLNGVVDGSATGKGSFTGSGPVWIGRFPDQDWFFPGQIAELRIWRTARSAAEIRAAMHQRLAGDESGLTGVWPLDDGEGEAAANAGASLAGRNFGATPVTPSPPPATAIPEALELNGTSSYLEIPHHGDLAFARPDEDFTLELWVKADDQPAGDEDERVVVEKWKGGGGFPWALRYRGGSGHFVFARSSGATPHPEVVSTDAVSDAGFHHLAAVREGTTLKLYVDGEAQGQATDTVASTIRGTASLYVGSRAGGSHFFEGTVSELRLWRRARTAEEIGAAMASRLSGDEVDLAGYWPLDEIAVRDALVRPAGTLTAATWADAPELPLLDADVAAEARTAPALEFDGTRSAVTVPASASLTPAAALTVEAWVRPAVTGTRAFLAPVVSLCDAAGGWELRAADAEYGFLLTVAGTQHVVTAAPAGDGECWTHLAATFDGSRLQLHVNGVALPAAGRDAAGEVSPCSRPLSLGRSSWWPERRFTGELAEVRVWNVARTAAEIQAHLFARLGGDEAGLVGYWQASEGEGETVGHASDAALDGIAENVRWVASDLPPRVAPGEVVETDLAWQIENLESRVAARTEELRKAIQEQQYRTARKAELATQLAEGDALWEEERADLQATLEGEIADRKAQLEALDAAQREADLEVVDALLDDVVEDAHTRIGQARTVLGQRDGHFGLNRVGMNLRYVAGAGGRGALFPARDAAVDAKRIAGLRLDFTPGKTAAPAAVAQRRVPRVVGYTEAVAQRKLKQAGYLPEVHAQAVSPGDRVGRVVSQFPAADTEAPARTAVRVFLGKAG